MVVAIRTLRVSGAESLACHEAVQLAALGYEVEVWYQIDGPFRAKLVDAGVKTIRVPLWSGRRRLRKLSGRASGWLVIHTHSPSSGAFLRLFSLGIGNVAFIHTEHNVSAAYRPVTRLLHRVMAWRIDELVAVSAAALETAPPTRRRRVLHHMNLALPRMQACLSLPPKLGGPLRGVCVASLTEKKDHANLLGALIILDRRLDGPLKVSLVGDGPLRDLIASQVAVLNRGCQHITVEMLGHRDDIASVLGDADVLVLLTERRNAAGAHGGNGRVHADRRHRCRRCAGVLRRWGSGDARSACRPGCVGGCARRCPVRPRSAGTACGSSEGPSPRPGGDSMAGHLRPDDRSARPLTRRARATAVPPTPTVHETASGSLRS